MEPKINQMPRGQTISLYASILHDSRTFYTEDMDKKRVTVKAPLPETFGFGLGNNIDQAFSLYQAANKLIQTLAPATHMNINKGFSERQYWKNAENQEITLELTFNAYYSGLIDVVRPVNDLMALAAPVESSIDGTSISGTASDFLTAYWNAPPRVTIIMGELLWFSNCWIKNINVAFSNKLDNEFNPLSANVSLTFMTEDPIGYNGIRAAGGPETSGFTGFTGEVGNL